MNIRTPRALRAVTPIEAPLPRLLLSPAAFVARLRPLVAPDRASGAHLLSVAPPLARAEVRS